MNYLISLIFIFLSAYLWAGISYLFLSHKNGKSILDKQRFLAKHYPFYARDTWKVLPDIDVDEKIIKKAGNRGWTFFFFPLFSISIKVPNYNFESLGFEHISMLIYQGVLFFAGLFFAYSWVGLKFLRELNIKSYRKETFEETGNEI